MTLTRFWLGLSRVVWIRRGGRETASTGVWLRWEIPTTSRLVGRGVCFHPSRQPNNKTPLISARGESRRPKTLSPIQRQDTPDLVFGTCATSGSKNNQPPSFRPSQVSFNTLACSFADGSDCQTCHGLAHSMPYWQFDQLDAQQGRSVSNCHRRLCFSFLSTALGQKPTQPQG
ncbi:hypothetical protein LX32DRAFT_382643 [Colletotrichum zoysiae]|uniref:Uncharacterized protein n=1 Tax=Colletotrichum zoysiae TaxID=1216348 RepID=A0AAD9M1S5_9PEZI|nr:hypothetical protein LX32DRAFT_382643 [Colletotrichum zoysiae]